MSDVPERIALRWVTGAAVTSGPLMTHPEYTQFVRADLAQAPDAGVAELVEAAKGLKAIVEEIRGAMEHGTWRDEKGQRLKDTPEWVTFYNALAKLEIRA